MYGTPRGCDSECVPLSYPKTVAEQPSVPLYRHYRNAFHSKKMKEDLLLRKIDREHGSGPGFSSLDVVASIPISRSPSPGRPHRVSQGPDNSAKRLKCGEKVELDTLHEVYRPVFSRLHVCEGREAEGPGYERLQGDSFDAATELRNAALAEYSAIFNCMREWLLSDTTGWIGKAKKNRSALDVVLSTPSLQGFIISHQLLDLYALLWYSPVADGLEGTFEGAPVCTTTSRMKMEGGAATTRGFQSSLKTRAGDKGTTTGIDSSSRFLPALISRAKVSLYLWHLKHNHALPFQRLIAQASRAANVFDFRPEASADNVPPRVLVEETALQLVRLLMVGELDSFLHLLTLFAARGEPVAQALAKHVFQLDFREDVHCVALRLRSQLLSEATHHVTLARLRRMAKPIQVKTSTGSARGCEVQSSSVFALCVQLLSGDQSDVDSIVHKAFPGYWTYCFCLGLFWRCFDVPLLVADIQRLLGTQQKNVGTIVALFYNKWLEDMQSEKGKTVLRLINATAKDMALSAFLANDLDEAIAVLKTHIGWPVTAVLIDLIVMDHVVLQEDQIIAENCLNASLYCNGVLGLPELASTFFQQAFAAGRRDYERRQFMGGGLGFLSSLDDASQTLRRSGRYGCSTVSKEKEVATVTSEGHDNEGDSAARSNTTSFQNQLQVLCAVINTPVERLPETLRQCCAVGAQCGVLAHLMYRLRAAEDHSSVCYFTDLFLQQLAGMQLDEQRALLGFVKELFKNRILQGLDEKEFSSGSDLDKIQKMTASPSCNISDAGCPIGTILRYCGYYALLWGLLREDDPQTLETFLQDGRGLFWGEKIREQDGGDRLHDRWTQENAPLEVHGGGLSELVLSPLALEDDAIQFSDFDHPNTLLERLIISPCSVAQRRIEQNSEKNDPNKKEWNSLGMARFLFGQVDFALLSDVPERFFRAGVRSRRLAYLIILGAYQHEFQGLYNNRSVLESGKQPTSDTVFPPQPSYRIQEALSWVICCLSEELAPMEDVDILLAMVLSVIEKDLTTLAIDRQRENALGSPTSPLCDRELRQRPTCLLLPNQLKRLAEFLSALAAGRHRFSQPTGGISTSRDPKGHHYIRSTLQDRLCSALSDMLLYQGPFYSMLATVALEDLNEDGIPPFHSTFKNQRSWVLWILSHFS